MLKILENIKLYDILTNIFPGIIFLFLLDFLLGIKIIKKISEIEIFFIYYFVGFTLNRIGSIIESFLLKMGIMKSGDKLKKWTNIS